MGAMAVTRTKAEEFRRLAQECRATAQTLSTEQARAEMLAMADVCDRVAAQPTHGTDVSEAGAVVRLMTIVLQNPAAFCSGGGFEHRSTCGVLR
jgi:pyruvate-formate lyase